MFRTQSATSIARRAVHHTKQTSISAAQPTLARCFRQPTRRFGTTSRCGEDRPSFKGQLYESTQQRLIRERAEQARYARAQHDTTPGIRAFAMTVVLISASLGCYYLGSLKPASIPTTSTSPLAATRPPRHDTSPSNLQAAWADLVEIVGKENVSTANHDVDAHAGSEWFLYAYRK
ncbi:D-lactate dehydrogenase [Histoplasma capsulatum H143]|uniref:D-lactate dehydrogenase n=1 Tax=Ajellomyces capsulatus (strain H143) TaxID=544712 RepID=C6H3U5_AJECH|nr:D-lactate dehydrogenase [Histoplasma capsulatum H143]